MYTEDKIHQLEHQVNYLIQEVEFLKKFLRSEIPGSRGSRFRAKTTEHILKLREEFQGQTIFGRSDVMRVLDMKASLFFRRPGAARLLAIYRRIHLQVLAC